MPVDNAIWVSGVRYDSPVGKRITKSDDGGVVKTPLTAERANPGVLINKAFGTAEEAFDFHLSADATIMFFGGTFQRSIENGVLVSKMGLERAKNHLTPNELELVLTATKEFLEFRPGAGLLRIDVDFKSPGEVAAIWPQDQAPINTAEEVLESFLEVLPEATG